MIVLFRWVLRPFLFSREPDYWRQLTVGGSRRMPPAAFSGCM